MSDADGKRAKNEKWGKVRTCARHGCCEWLLRAATRCSLQICAIKVAELVVDSRGVVRLGGKIISEINGQGIARLDANGWTDYLAVVYTRPLCDGRPDIVILCHGKCHTDRACTRRDGCRKFDSGRNRRGSDGITPRKQRKYEEYGLHGPVSADGPGCSPAVNPRDPPLMSRRERGYF